MHSQSGAAAEVRALPGGGGATRPIGETFEPDLFSGTGNFSVPLWFPDGPGRLKPDVSLGYSTGRGNGVFGLGWSLGTLRITRRTDQGLPEYDDGADTILLDGAELVETVPGRYRLRREGAFFAVERQGDHWSVRDRTGRTYTVGDNPDARVSDRAVPGRIAEWRVTRVENPHGIGIDYTYRRDGEQLYLDAISYGPYSVRFEYGPRSDVLVDRRYAFPVTTALRCTGISYRLDGVADPFRRYDLAYEECPYSGVSLLTGIRSTGTRNGVTTSLPPLTLSYSRFEPSRRLVPMTSDVGSVPPRALDEANVDLVDLDGVGLPGALELTATSRRFWPNLGDGRWGPPRTLRRVPIPASLGSPAVALGDMDGDAAVDMLVLDRRPFGYYRGGDGGFEEHVGFPKGPTFDFREGGVRLVDLDGDGIVDVLRSTHRALYAFGNRGRNGWESPTQLATRRGPDSFADVDLADGRVRLADMTGDGLCDLIRVHAGLIEYWPHLGHGRFDERVRIPFVHDLHGRFDPARLFVADVTGSGPADLVYVDRDRVILWCNRAGRAFSQPTEIRHTPSARAGAISLVDMTGSGTSDVLWTNAMSRLDPENYKFLALGGEQRPYLLTRIDHGVGLMTEIRYDTAAHQARVAAAEGRPWSSGLPFAVPVVQSLTERDIVRDTSQVRQFRYHDGYFDPHDREFAGFGRVETLDVGDEHADDLRTVTTFLQGRPHESTGSTHTERRAARGMIASVAVYDRSGDPPIRHEQNEYQVVPVEGGQVHFAHLRRSEVVTTKGGIQQTVATTLGYDDVGNIILKEETWDAPGGQQSLSTRMRFTADKVLWILALPVERIQRDGAGALLGWERFYYDGPAFEGLPLGQVTHGLLTRHEEMTLTDALVAAVYGSELPNPAQLGLHRMQDPAVGSGWGLSGAAYRRDADGTPTAYRNARGVDTTLTYDADRVRVHEATNSLGHTTRITAERTTGQIIELLEPNGLATRYSYDAVGRLEFMVKPGDSAAHPTISLSRTETSFPFGLRADVRQMPGDPQTISQVEYLDGHQERIQTRIEAEGGRVIVDGWRGYDARGFEVGRTSPFFSNGLAYVPEEGKNGMRRYTLSHDALGRPTAVVTPDGGTGSTLYVPGRTVRIDAAGVQRVETADAKSNIWEVIEDAAGPSPAATRFERDALGRVVRVVDAKSQVLATYSYDLVGRRIQVDHADAGQRRVAYEPLGNVALMLDAVGHRTEITHDVLGRTLRVVVDGIPEEVYTYDTGSGQNLIGRLASVTDRAGSTEFSYDSRGTVSEKTRHITTVSGAVRGLTVGFLHDSAQHVRRVTYPDGSSVDYAYGRRGLLDSVTGIVASVTYDEFERATEITYSSGTSEKHDFDLLSFFETRATVSVPTSPGPAYDIRYRHDAVGNVLQMADQVASGRHTEFDRVFEYGSRNQIAGVQGSVGGSPFNVRYRFDETGNPIEFGEFGAGTFLLAEGRNRLANVVDAGGVEIGAFAHDANGNLVSVPGRTYGWDARGRLERVQLDDGTVIEMSYGYDGGRVSKRVTTAGGTVETLYLDDYYEERGTDVIRHVIHDGRRLATLTRGTTRFLHRDHAGSVVLVTDQTGAVVRECGCLPFGSVAFSTGAGGPLEFGAADVDVETGLVYAGARYYDPHLGRFLSVDMVAVLQPEKFVGMPLHLNPYIYAGNNPLRFIDDTGLWWKWLVGGLIIAALVVATIVVGIATGGVGFAFGILLAASIGSALGAGVGVVSAYSSGGDLADGFLFGSIIGGVGGAAGYLAAAGVAAAGLSGVWGSILAGAAQGAVIGVANGAIVGYGGGTGNLEQILLHAAIGMAIGAIVGGAVGGLSYSTPQVAGTTEKLIVTSNVKGTASEGFWRGAAQALDFWEPAAQAAINSIATPVGTSVAISVGTAGGVLAIENWDEVRAWVLDVTGKDEITLPVYKTEF